MAPAPVAPAQAATTAATPARARRSSLVLAPSDAKPQRYPSPRQAQDNQCGTAQLCQTDPRPTRKIAPACGILDTHVQFCTTKKHSQTYTPEARHVTAHARDRRCGISPSPSINAPFTSYRIVYQDRGHWRPIPPFPAPGDGTDPFTFCLRLHWPGKVQTNAQSRAPRPAKRFTLPLNSRHNTITKPPIRSLCHPACVLRPRSGGARLAARNAASLTQAGCCASTSLGPYRWRKRLTLALTPAQAFAPAQSDACLTAFRQTLCASIAARPAKKSSER